MLARPRVFAVPHLGGPMGEGGISQACDPYNGVCACPNDFSCDPYKDSGCIDATYCGGSFAIVGVVAIIVGPLPGTT